MAELSLRRNVYAGRGDFGFGSFQAPTGSMSMNGGGTLSTIISAASNLLQPLIQSGGLLNRGPTTGMTTMGLGGFGSLLPPLGQNVIGSAVNRLLGTGGGGELFGVSAERVRPLRNVPVTGPDGRFYWFGYLGRPVLWSGDIAAARRVQRVARRAGRAASRRRSVRRR